jgi:hypothetical protein
MSSILVNLGLDNPKMIVYTVVIKSIEIIEIVVEEYYAFIQTR